MRRVLLLFGASNARRNWVFRSSRRRHRCGKTFTGAVSSSIASVGRIVPKMGLWGPQPGGARYFLRFSIFPRNLDRQKVGGWSWWVRVKEALSTGKEKSQLQSHRHDTREVKEGREGSQIKEWSGRAEGAGPLCCVTISRSRDGEVASGHLGIWASAHAAKACHPPREVEPCCNPWRPGMRCFRHLRVGSFVPAVPAEVGSRPSNPIVLSRPSSPRSGAKGCVRVRICVRALSSATSVGHRVSSFGRFWPRHCYLRASNVIQQPSQEASFRFSRQQAKRRAGIEFDCISCWRLCTAQLECDFMRLGR